MITFIKEGTVGDHVRKNLLGEVTYTQDLKELCPCGKAYQRTWRFMGDVSPPTMHRNRDKFAYEILDYCSDCDGEELESRTVGDDG